MFSSMSMIKEVKQDIFSVLADPTRRQILDALREQDQTVMELVKKVKIKQSGVSRHLAILSKSGLVSSQKDAQKHIYSLQLEPFRELDSWLEQYRTLWSSRFKKLDEHLKLQKEKRNGK